MAPDDKLKLVGTVLDKKYKITELLGEGGMGAVYGATHQHLNRSCAVKVISHRHVADPVALRRFKLEAEAASLLKHPNIIEIYDFGITDDEQAYIVMERVDGESLDDLLSRHKFLHYEIAVPIFLQVCDALAHAHERKVLHRDLKPGNIMLLKEGDRYKVKLVDFGVAKLLPGTGRTVDKMTATGEIFGSPLYMSPEQCMGQSLDVRSDIYALGCVVYQTLTGKLPFVGDSLFEVVMQHVNVLPPTFAHVAPDVAIPEKLEKLVFRSISKERTLRFNTVQDFKVALMMISRVGHFSEVQDLQGINPRPGLDAAIFPDTMPDLQGKDKSGLDTTQKSEATPDMTQPPPKPEPEANSQRAESAPPRQKKALGEPEGWKLDDSFFHEPGIDDDETYLLERLKEEKAKDEFNEKSLRTLGELAVFYGARSDYERNIVCNQKQLEIIRYLFGPDTLDEAFLLERIGLDFYLWSKYDTSEFCYRRSLELKREHLRDDDPDIIRSLCFLAKTLMCKSQLEEALELLRTARNLAEKYLGDKNLDTAEVYSLLGDAFFADATYAKSFEFYSKELDAKKELLLDTDMELRPVYTNLARCKYMLKQYQSAIKLCDEANRITDANPRKLSGLAEPPYTLLLSIYSAMNEVDKAKASAHKSIQILEQFEGPDSFYLPPVLDELADLYELNEMDEDARPLRERAAQIREHHGF